MRTFILLIALLFGGGTVYFAQQKIEIHQIDVGTGDAALINIMNNGGGIQYSILIDAGETYMNENVIDYLNSNAKQQNGYVYLDYVLTSHYHSDHIGGMVGQKKTLYTAIPGSKKRKCVDMYSGVLGDTSQVKVYAVLDKGDTPPTSPSDLYKKYKNLAGTRRVAVGTSTVGSFGAVNSINPSGVFPPPQPANQGLSLGGYINLGADVNGVPVRLRLILADSKVYYPGGPSNTYNVADTLSAQWGQNVRTRRTNPNNWGLGWVLEYGAFRWYTAGDVGGYNSSYGTCVSCGSNYFDIETPMSQAFPLIYTQPATAAGHICSQKLSHHGSCCSSNPAFLDTLKCSSAIFSSGPAAGFGHPTQEVIDRLEAGRWHRNGLTHDSVYAYLMTELYFHDRNINLNVGSTSGSVLLAATNLVVPPADIETAFTMANGSDLYKIDSSIPTVYGDITIQVEPVNAGISIAQSSVYTLVYSWYDGTQLTKTINCHAQ